MILVPRHRQVRHPATTPSGALAAGPWWWRTDTEGLTYRPVWLRCPNGHLGTLVDHEFAADGTVTPSVVCADPGCGWHEDVRLDGFAEEAHHVG